MYAVIETGGKQYRVEVGTVLEVEKLDVEAGSSITLDRVLLVADGEEAAIGRPVVADATVSAEVLRQDRADKVVSFKYRPKARRRVKKGHRQEQTVLRISDIMFQGRSAAETVRVAEEAVKTERERLEEAAARQAAADAALAAKLAARQEPKAEAGTAKGKAGRRTKTAEAKTEGAEATEPEAPETEPAVEAAPAVEAGPPAESDAATSAEAAPETAPDAATEAAEAEAPKRRRRTTQKKDE